jgi:hypothetical protein
VLGSPVLTTVTYSEGAAVITPDSLDNQQNIAREDGECWLDI